MRTVLLVDDEFDIRLVYSELLRMEGYKVMTASHGQEALDYLRSETVDLVITDVMMPVMGGVPFLREMRADEGLKEIPVILMSAARLALEAESTGFQMFLTKPIDADALLAAVNQCLAKAS